MKKKDLLKLLTTASVIAVASASTSALGADREEPAVFITGGDNATTNGSELWGNLQGNLNDKVIIVGSNHNLTFDVPTTEGIFHTVNLFGHNNRNLTLASPVTFAIESELANARNEIDAISPPPAFVVGAICDENGTENAAGGYILINSEPVLLVDENGDEDPAGGHIIYQSNIVNYESYVPVSNYQPGNAGEQAKANLIISDAITATLKDANFSQSLPHIQKIDFGADSTLILSAAGELTAQLKNTLEGAGNLVIDEEVTLKAVADMPNSTINSVKVNAGKHFTLDADLSLANGLSIGDADGSAITTINLGKTLTGNIYLAHKDATLNLAGNVIGNIKAGTDLEEIPGNGIINIEGDITTGGNIGCFTAAVDLINVAENKTFTVKNKVYTASTTLKAGSKLIIDGTASDVAYSGGDITLGKNQRITLKSDGEYNAQLIGGLTVNSEDAVLDLNGSIYSENGLLTVTEGVVNVTGIDSNVLKTAGGEGNIQLGAAGVLNLNGKLTANITAVANGNGVINVEGDSQIVGGLGLLNDQNIIGNIHFTNDSTLTISIAGEVPEITTAEDGKGTLVLDNSFISLNGNIGALKELHVKGNSIFLKGYNVLAPITVEEGVNLEVVQVAKNDLALPTIGSAEVKAGLVTLHTNQWTITVGEIFSKNITVTSQATGNVVFTANVNGDLTATSADTNATFNNGVNVLGSIKASSAGIGNFTFKGSHELGFIGTQLCPMKTLNFSGVKGSVVQLNNDIYSNDSSFGEGTFVANKSITITGNSNFNGSTIHVNNNNVLTFAGEVTLENNVTLGVDLAAENPGYLVLNDNLVVNESTTLTITNTDINKGLPAQNTKVKLAEGNAVATLDTDKLQIAQGLFQSIEFVNDQDNPDGLYIQAVNNNPPVGNNNPPAGNNNPPKKQSDIPTFSKDIKIIPVPSKVMPIEKVKENLKNKSVTTELKAEATGFIDLIANNIDNIAGTNSSISKIARVLNDLYTAGDMDQITKISYRMSPNVDIATTANITQSAVSAASTAIDTSSIGASSIAVAAGEELGRPFGLWASGFGAQFTQKMVKTSPGYKGKIEGGTLGVDSLITDDTLAGAALTYANIELKHKNHKLGDKTTSKNFLFTIYGNHDFTDKVFAKAVAVVGQGKVNNKEARGINEIATGKYDSMSYSLETLLGYKHSLNDSLVLTPLAGVKIGQIREDGYTETGANIYNQTVSKRSNDSVVGIVGARLQSYFALNNGLKFVPSLQARMEHDFRNKTKVVKVDIDGAPTRDIEIKPKDKNSYKIGTDLMIKSEAMEYGISYDLKLAEKFISHQGSLKVRVNF